MTEGISTGVTTIPNEMRKNGLPLLILEFDDTYGISFKAK